MFTQEKAKELLKGFFNTQPLFSRVFVKQDELAEIMAQELLDTSKPFNRDFIGYFLFKNASFFLFQSFMNEEIMPAQQRQKMVIEYTSKHWLMCEYLNEKFAAYFIEQINNGLLD